MGELKLQKSSGKSIFDMAALTATTEAAPFQELPSGSDEHVDIQFVFDYNAPLGTDKDPVKTTPSSSKAKRARPAMAILPSLAR